MHAYSKADCQIVKTPRAYVLLLPTHVCVYIHNHIYVSINIPNNNIITVY